jgi:small subunit ribosomal protein S21
MSKKRHANDPDNGMVVKVHNNDVNRALRRLKKLVNNEGVLKELRERQYYEKPSLKRKKAKAAARKRWLKKAAKEDLPGRQY